jgi:hypothetical protein
MRRFRRSLASEAIYYPWRSDRRRVHAVPRVWQPIGCQRLHQDVCRVIGASTNLVRIRHDYALKLTQKHKLDPRHVVLIPTLLEAGRAVLTKPLHITFFLRDPLLGWMHLTIKTIPDGNELWLPLHARWGLHDPPHNARSKLGSGLPMPRKERLRLGDSPCHAPLYIGHMALYGKQNILWNQEVEPFYLQKG